MNKIFHSTILTLLLLCIIAPSITSCIEEYNAALPSSESDLLVVEGTIISDSISTFYLSLTMPLNSGNGIKNVNNATIKLKGSDGTEVDGVMTAEGTYTINTPKLNALTQYKVIINYNGDTYESTEQTPFPTVAVQNVEFNQKTEDSNVDILITTAVPADPSETQYYRWTYKETWEAHPEYISMWVWDNDAKTVVYDQNAYLRRGWISASSGEILASSSAYYSNNQIVQYKLYDIENSNNRLYVKYSTEVTQRSLTKAEYEYETEREKISTEMGGLFTPQPSSLPTNIHCTTSSKHVLGYIGCSLNVARHRIFISPAEVNVVHEVNCIDSLTNGESNYSKEQLMYINGYKIFSYEKEGGVLEEFHWTSPSCVDISYMGASSEMPSFWKE